VHCARTGKCRFDPASMQGLFDAALRGSRHSDLLTMYGDYELNVEHDAPHALALWQEACARSPHIAQYRINLIKLLIALGHEQQARKQIETLRALGRLGQYETAARQLDLRFHSVFERRR
jgi:protein O-mannosyl-transferase